MTSWLKIDCCSIKLAFLLLHDLQRNRFRSRNIWLQFRNFPHFMLWYKRFNGTVYFIFKCSSSNSHNRHAMFKISKASSCRKSLQHKLQSHEYKTCIHTYISFSIRMKHATKFYDPKPFSEEPKKYVSWMNFIPAGVHGWKYTAYMPCGTIDCKGEMEQKKKLQLNNYIIQNIFYSDFFLLVSNSIWYTVYLFCTDVLI